jgi:transposase
VAVQVLSDEQWSILEPMVEACRPKGKTPPRDLRRTIEAIIWRCDNGAKWRAVPAELGPWWRAAQLFIRWSKLGAWERLLARAQEAGVRLGIVHLDGTTIRAHAKAAGARQKGALGANEVSSEHVRRLGALVAAMAQRPVWFATAPGALSPLLSDPARHTS